MQIKTRGIILHTLKYSENSVIVTIYTSEFGRTAYMVYGANKKKSKFRSAFFQPLSLLDLDVYHTPGKEIQTIKDLRTLHTISDISYHPIKNPLALFISEVLFRVLKQTEPDENLFNYLESSILALDCCEEGLANFHLVFMMKLCRYLGFEPNGDGSTNRYFDLLNGVFTQDQPQHMHFLNPEATIDFMQMMRADYLNMKSIAFTRNQRVKLLESLVEYYKLHVADFHGLNSLPVLHALFD